MVSAATSVSVAMPSVNRSTPASGWPLKRPASRSSAPGIAEALFATALGLVAAIPAVVAYNKLSNDLGRYAGRLESFAGEFTTLLSRKLGEDPM